LYGSEAAKARALHAMFDALISRGQVSYHPRSSVVALHQGQAQVIGPERAFTLPYDRLILATGATDRLVPLPGWQHPGLYSLGAAQIALKAQGVALGRQIVLAGSGPLLTLLAHQLIHAGANVAAVLDTSPRGSQILGGLGMFTARPWVSLRGMAMRLGLGRRYRCGVTLERIDTDERGPVALHWRKSDGTAQATPCDMIGLGWHLRAETQLAELAGAELVWSPPFHQWLPRIDAMGRAGAGLYLAGDGARPLGADGAELAGQLAAIACLQDLGLPHRKSARLRRNLRRMERFARAVARAFPWPADMVRRLPDDTILCRCEGISAGALREMATQSGPEINRAKSLSRVGMGRCQGRYCQLAGAEMLSAVFDLPPAEVGRLRAQPPVRPAPIAAYLDRAD
ncbi:NAD(P)/FAD-dependent oxidoreductase, partial [Thioclava sp. BHET1]